MDAAVTVRTTLDQLVTRGRLPGIQYAVVDRNGVQFEYQAGIADLAVDKPVSAGTTFMASSSTKVITAAAILQLVEKNRVALDRPLSAYYSAHPYGDRVTIRHLLAQTSGIPNPLPLKWLHLVSDHDRYDEESALKQVMSRRPRRVSEPGEQYSYSNISYWLLGKVIESVSGRSYEEYVREHIFDALGVRAEAASFQIKDPGRHARGYQKFFSLVGLSLYLLMDRRVIGETVRGYATVLPVYMNGPAYGGLICTASGFALFLQDMLRSEPRLLASETRDLFLTEQTTTSGRPTGMTLGWRVGALQGEPWYGKPGGGPGFRSNVRLYPGPGIGVAWLANETGVNEQQMNAISDSMDRHWLSGV
ncbi:MAG TPA: serine hydrolase domain-containing protein [Terriglobia bacterium]|nr:serine hydrolase domain-containing protein [Terriglobia bacterium]